MKANETRLVILGPEHPHSARTADSPARKAVEEVLNSRGTSPRLLKNTVVFMAADRSLLDQLKRAVREYLAWRSIHDDRETLNLDTSQSRQAERRYEEADKTVDLRVPEAFQWLLVPGEQFPADAEGPALTWEESRVTGQDPLAVRASKRLKADTSMIVNWAGTLLRTELDKVPLWDGNHVAVKQLIEYFARYLYLPRLRDSQVLIEAVRDGVARTTWMQDSFAYADGFDEAKQRYLGLQAGKLAKVSADGAGLLVKPEVAKAQKEAEEPPQTHTAGGGDSTGGEKIDAINGGGPRVDEDKSPKDERPAPRRFHGSVSLNPIRLGRDASTIAQEIVQHLTKLNAATVEITLEIEAAIPEGAPDNVVRTVTENCRTLKFRTHGFEED